MIQKFYIDGSRKISHREVARAILPKVMRITEGNILPRVISVLLTVILPQVMRITGGNILPRVISVLLTVILPQVMRITEGYITTSESS